MHSVYRVCLLALLFSPVICAWGPYTHQHFGAQDPSRAGSAAFLAGCSAPDAFKGREPSLHSLAFSSALYETAHRNGSEEAIDFALGWGCHLTQDAIGHHARGFLNPLEDHLLEFAVDSYVYHNFGHRFLQIDSLAEALVVAASANTSTPITKAAASKCVSKFKVLTTTESAALEVNFLYKKQMVSDSFCNVSGSFGAVTANFHLAQNWTQNVCSAWQAAMLTPSAGNPVAEIQSEIQRLFDGNKGSSCI